MPYLIAGALATLVLLASGTLAVAPYVAFLSPIAAFNVALPVALSLFVLSAVVIAISCRMISQNKKLDEKEAELNEKIELAAEQENTIQSLEPQIKGLNKKVSNLETKFNEKLDSFIKEVEVKEELQMKFYGKDEEREKITFKDIILPSDKKQELKKICESQKESGAALKKEEGYILYGLPGTGKTMIAKAIASETKGKSAFISISGSSLFNIQNINDLFEKAKENAPCIVFIDEIEGFGKMRNPNGDNVQYLNHFLTKIGGFDPIKGVTVIVATNHIDVLDAALTRRGRLCNHIKISTLDTDTRKKIINEYCQKEKLPGALTNKILNNTSENFSPANLMGLLEEIKKDKETLNVTKIATICRDFKKTHGIDRVSNKQCTNGNFENSGGESRQTSTPKTKKTSTKKSLNLSESPIVGNNSPNLSGKKKSPRKSPKKEDEDENKENSGLQNQKSPNASFRNTNSSPFKNRTNNLGSSLTP